MDAQPHRRRRAALSAACPNWTFVLPSSKDPRPDANLYYLTGHDEPGATLVMRGEKAILYVPEPDATHARWWGATTSLADAGERAGVDDVRPATKLFDDLDEHLKAGEIIGHRLGVHARLDARIVDGLHSLATRRGGRAIRPLHDPREPLGRLRLRKDAGELARLRAAARITVAAHGALAETARAGDTELALSGRFEASCRAGGAAMMAYDTIVARGARATCLHAHPTRTALGDGDWVLVDGGAQLDAYACDVTRTWAVGRLEGPRAALYDVVLDAQLAALAAVKPGTTLDAIHTMVKERLAEGLCRLELPGAVEAYFPHGTSHWLGLEVHDGSSYDEGGAPVVLEAGMVFTVEPGLYVDESDATAPSALRGVGVRIEDTVAVTEDGVEVLTEAMPKERAALYALRS